MRRPCFAAFVLSLWVLCVWVLCIDARSAEASLQFGFAKADITPSKPLRLSGYGNRSKPSEGVDEPLFVRVMVCRDADQKTLHAIVSVDTIGVPGSMTKAIHERIAERHPIPRAQFVLCSTHSHTAPHISAGLTNLFATPLTDDERRNLDEYAQQVSDQVVAAVDAAVADLKPGRMFVGEGEATFAVNRRVLQNGVWTGFGVNPTGPVDHTLPIIKVTDASGNEIRGLLYNYACHCTTFDSDHNRVNGDWAGYASQFLERKYAGAVALCTIGCGADANPERDRARAMQIAKAQGTEIAEEVQQVIAGSMREITAAPRGSFGYAGLPIDRPSLEELRANLKSDRPQVRVHAENMLAVHERMGRLPETYPMPIQVFRFGDQFSMVFLGGEVCVDYARRIKRELGAESVAAGQAAPANSAEPAQTKKDDAPTKRVPPPVWVTAYANDVFGYVASERMRDEGGYEVDFSMVFYNQPGRWSSGTEDVILRRVHELHESRGEIGPLSPEDSLGYFTVPEGFTIDIVAAEPLIRDPINFALAADGRLWVVEMGDYPNGNPDLPAPHDGNGEVAWDARPGGCIKVLTDTDADGRYDKAETFLDGLTFPTGVFPWRDGTVVSGAPEIFFAQDTDGDGRADVRKVLFRGLHTGNPQHLVSGFAYGLDGWLYLAGASSSRTIESAVTGQEIATSGRDLRIDPDTGRGAAVSGVSQYGRSRDDWGNWFGNSNSRPLFHFVIEDRYLQRNPYVSSPSPQVYLTEPAVAPQVYPTSRTLDRFNDLFALNRFTSACSPIIVRDGRFAPDIDGAALVCEPVHNLVSRVMLEQDGVTFRGDRHAEEQGAEFLSSQDNWFRPVRLQTGPDASIWICDMYRYVIEHPQWIPESWQAQLDLYAGDDKGRIYRLRPQSEPATAAPNLAILDSRGLVRELASPNGWRRDTAQQLLLERGDVSVAPAIEALATGHKQPAVRIQAAATLHALGRLSADVITKLLADSDPRVAAQAVQLSESVIEDQQILARLLTLVDHPDVRVRYQLALTLGESTDPRVAGALTALVPDDSSHPWMRAAVVSSASPHAKRMLHDLLADRNDLTGRARLLEELIATALGDDISGTLSAIVSAIVGDTRPQDVADWQIAAMARCVDAVRRRGENWSEVAAGTGPEGRSIAEAAHPVFWAARAAVGDANRPIPLRVSAVRLLGQEGRGTREADLRMLTSLVSPQVAPELQIAAVNALAACRAPNLAEMLINDWPQQTPAVRGEVLSTLLSRREWTNELITALEDGRVPPQDLDASTRARLQEHLRKTGRALKHSLFETSDAGDRPEIVATFASVGALTERAEQGAVVFKKVCGTCHQHGGIGNDLGPTLSNLKDKSTAALLTAILDPNRAVEQKFRGYTVLTRDGRVVNGLVKSETASSITLVEPSGKEHELLRIEIEEMRDTGKSFMPEGMERDLKPQDMADVIAFITSEE